MISPDGGGIGSVRSRLADVGSRMSRSFPPNLAKAMLVACAALWGGSYVVAKFVLETVPPQWLMFLRLSGSCLVMLALFHRSILRAMHRDIIVPALVVGITYYASMVTQTEGLLTVDPGRSSFLSSAYCVLTPFVLWAVTRRSPRSVHVVAAVVCLAGVGFVALRPSSASLQLSRGDWLTLSCALFFSLNLVALGVYTRRFNPIAMTFVQFAVGSVLFLAGALATEEGPAMRWLSPGVVGGFLYLLLGATTLAQIMQNIGLAHVPTASASIIMCSESLFSVLFSAIFWGEGMGWTSLVGFALIFASMLMASVEWRRDRRRPGRWRIPHGLR